MKNSRIFFCLLFVYTICSCPPIYAQIGAKNFNSEANLKMKLSDSKSAAQVERLPDNSNLSSDSLFPKSAICLDIKRLMGGTMLISYERALKKNLSIDIGLMGTYTSRGRYSFNRYRSQVNGVGVRVQLRNYLSAKINPQKQAPSGWYVAPELMYRYLVVSRENPIWNEWMEEYSTNDIVNYLGVGSASFLLGHKFFIANIICFDMYFGGVLRLSKYTNEDHMTRFKNFYEFDYSGVMPTIGVNIGILK